MGLSRIFIRDCISGGIQPVRCLVRLADGLLQFRSDSFFLRKLQTGGWTACRRLALPKCLALFSACFFLRRPLPVEGGPVKGLASQLHGVLRG